ncbi:MAG: YiiD C-terminal domain-containing protein [Flavobacteriales bacterium]|nr:YiiD C-terminal domain-containing protein [Flavobacteriales bacterium]
MSTRNRIFSKYLKLINYWPPYVGAGIKLKEVNEDRTRFLVSLRLTSRNKNLFGTQFGGSLYAMTDPFYAFILVLNLGQDYIVWDKSASIDFIKPGKSKVFVKIEIEKEEVENIKQEIDSIGKSTYTFQTNIYDIENNTIATVVKEVYIRKKNFEKISIEL